MIFDTHAHYDDEAFDEDREELLSSLPEAGIKAVVNVGASLESTERSLGLAARYPFVYAAVGVHPSECGEMKEEDIRWLKKASAEEKARRVLTETGLYDSFSCVICAPDMVISYVIVCVGVL